MLSACCWPGSKERRCSSHSPSHHHHTDAPRQDTDTMTVHYTLTFMLLCVEAAVFLGL